MSHKIYLMCDDGIENEISYEDFNFIKIVLRNLFHDDSDFRIEIDHTLVNLSEFIELIRLNPQNRKFKPCAEVETSEDLADWIDAISILNKLNLS
jgi:hypothetical protein